jgi:imidazolonepropionase-like amidohydrolase
MKRAGNNKIFVKEKFVSNTNSVALSRETPTTQRHAPAMKVTSNALSWLAIACAALIVPRAASAWMTPESDTPAVVISNVTIVDVDNGRTTEPKTVVIKNGRIVSIGTSPATLAGKSVRQVDGRGRFLIPGLTDMHVHLFNLSSHRPPNDWSFGLYVANGVTGVRDMRADAASMQLVKGWRAAVDNGQLIAPHILAAGIAVYGASPESAAADVDAAANAGTDFIKVFSEVPTTHWRAILAEAKQRSLTVVGHVPATVSLLDAARSGQRTSEHLTQTYEACSSAETATLKERHPLQGDALMSLAANQEKHVLETFNATLCESVAKTLATTGMVQVPTLALADEDDFARNTQRETDSRWPLLRADEQARWQRFIHGYTQEDAALATMRWPIARRIISIMHKAGVPILAGTDSPMPGEYPGFALQDELQLLVQSGLTPMEALRAATIEPAKFLHIDKASGSVAVGKRADLVLLDADPTKDIRNARRIRAVVLAGRVLDRADLDVLLKPASKAPQP